MNKIIGDRLGTIEAGTHPPFDDVCFEHIGTAFVQQNGQNDVELVSNYPVNFWGAGAVAGPTSTTSYCGDQSPCRDSSTHIDRNQ